jgi:hypothetical protein
VTEFHISPKSVGSTFTKMTLHVEVSIDQGKAMSVNGYNRGGEVVTLWDLNTGVPLKWIGGIAQPGARAEWFLTHTGASEEPAAAYEVLSKLRPDYQTEGAMKGEQCFEFGKNLCEDEYGMYANECSWHEDSGEYCGPGIFYEKTIAHRGANGDWVKGSRDIKNKLWWHWNKAPLVKTGSLKTDFYLMKAAVYKSNGHFAVLDFHQDMKIESYYVPGDAATKAPTTLADQSVQLPDGTLESGVNGFDVNFQTKEVVTTSQKAIVGGSGYRSCVTLWNVTNGRTIRAYRRAVETSDDTKTTIPVNVNWDTHHAVVAHRNYADVYDLYSTSSKPKLTLQGLASHANRELIQHLVLEATKEPEQREPKPPYVAPKKKKSIYDNIGEKIITPIIDLVTSKGKEVFTKTEHRIEGKKEEGDISGE